MPERYEPAEQEQRIAEEFLTVDDWQRKSEERAEALKDSVPGQLHPKLFTLLNRLDERLFDLTRLDQVAEIEGLTKKPEFHTTLIGFTRGKEVKTKLAMMPWEQRESAKIELDKLVQEMDWTPIAADPVTYRIAKDYVKIDDEGENRQHKTHDCTSRKIGRYAVSITTLVTKSSNFLILERFPSFCQGRQAQEQPLAHSNSDLIFNAKMIG